VAARRASSSPSAVSIAAMSAGPSAGCLIGGILSVRWCTGSVQRNDYSTMWRALQRPMWRSDDRGARAVRRPGIRLDRAPRRWRRLAHTVGARRAVGLADADYSPADALAPRAGVRPPGAVSPVRHRAADDPARRGGEPDARIVGRAAAE